MPTVFFCDTPYSITCACRTYRDEDSAHRLPIVYYYTMPILDMRFPGEPVEERAIRPHTVVMGQLYCVRVLAMGDRTGIGSRPWLMMAKPHQHVFPTHYCWTAKLFLTLRSAPTAVIHLLNPRVMSPVYINMSLLVFIYTR